MTTKDQAIALALAHLTDPNTYDDQKISEAARVLRKTQAQLPTPDCRTCGYLRQLNAPQATAPTVTNIDQRRARSLWG